MTREEARKYYCDNWESIIPNMTSEAARKVNGRTSWVCPLCGHGSHGDGLTFNPRSKNGKGLKCFNIGCQFSGDIIDLYQKQNDVDYNKALEDLANICGITIDRYDPRAAAAADFSDIENPKQPQNAANAGAVTGVTQQQKAATGDAQAFAEPVQYDFTEAVEAAHRALLSNETALNYFLSRGLTLETIEKYKLGFSPNGYNAMLKNYPEQRSKARKSALYNFILPYPDAAGRYSYFLSEISDRNQIDDYNGKYRKISNIPARLFNERYLQDEKPGVIFICEGVYDALSVEQSGGRAMAFVGTADKIFLGLCEKYRPNAAFVISLDNDGPGRLAADRVKNGLAELGLPFIVKPAEIGKDFNENLQRDSAGLRQYIRKTVTEAQHLLSAKPDNTAFYIDQFMTGDIDRFKVEVKTGFENLDGIIGGGLYNGLYCLAATSSLGKTTFALQMADQIAAAGHDVIFFSLEQSRLEMVSKSLARITAQEDRKTAVTSLSIRKGYLPAQVIKAAETYTEQVQDRISIVEGNFTCNVSFIGDYIRQYIRRNDTRPVVFVDYLQILQPEEEHGKRQTTKEVVDTTVTELKRLSREMGLTVFAVSAVNRANYLTPINFESLKESGCIEYTCDCVLGLQLQILKDPNFESIKAITKQREAVKQAENETPRKIDLVCLKNRYGKKNTSCSFLYYPENDLYTPQTDFDSMPEGKPAGSRSRYGR